MKSHEEPDETEENNYEIDNNLHISPTPAKKRKPNIMKLSEKYVVFCRRKANGRNVLGKIIPQYQSQ